MAMKFICLSNMPYLTGEVISSDKPMTVSLTVGAVYDAQLEGEWLRVWDNTGEDYLYPPEMFRAANWE